MMNTIYFFILLSVALSCGEDDKKEEIKEDDNQLSEIEGQGQGGDGNDDPSSQEGLDESQYNWPDGNCLTDCSLPLEARLSFSPANAISPENCVVEKYEVFDHKSFTRLVYSADCGFGYQVYMADLLSPDDRIFDPINISKDCTSYFNDILDFASDVADDGSQIIVYTCESASEETTARAVRIEVDKTIKEAIDLNLGSNEAWKDDDYSIKWNEVAGAYGLVSLNRFKRLDSFGRPLGGTVILGPNNGRISSIDLVDGEWIITNVFSYNRDYYRSKVTKEGILNISQKLSDLPRSHVFNRNFSTGYSDGQFLLSPFNHKTLALAPSKVIYDPEGEDIAFILARSVYTDNLGFILYSNADNTLRLLIFKYGLFPESIAVLSLHDASENIMWGSLSMSENNIMSWFLSEGRVYMTKAKR